MVDELGIVMWECKCGKHRYNFQITCKYCGRSRTHAIKDPMASVDHTLKDLLN